MVLRQITYICEECMDGEQQCKFVAFYPEEYGKPFCNPKRCPYKTGFVKAKWKRVD